MENRLMQQSRAHIPKKTVRTIKETSLLIDELEAKRERESEFYLTSEETMKYMQLESIFHVARPAKDIASALEDEMALKDIRRKFLIAAKIKNERLELKENSDKDSVGMLLIAAGTPVVLVGVTLLETFMTAGIGVIAAGAVMYVPAFIKEITHKRKIKKELKDISKQLEVLSDDIDKRSKNVDRICSLYGIPINCLEREVYIASLLDAANEFERLSKKKTDYDLLLKLNESEAISRKISSNIKMLSGIAVSNENEYKTALSKLTGQMY